MLYWPEKVHEHLKFNEVAVQLQSETKIGKTITRHLVISRGDELLVTKNRYFLPLLLPWNNFYRMTTLRKSISQMSTNQ